MNQNKDIVYKRSFNHFKERLLERYNIEISFDEYIILCKKKIRINKNKNHLSAQKKRVHGFVFFKGIELFVVQYDGSVLITCLENYFKAKETQKTKRFFNNVVDNRKDRKYDKTFFRNNENNPN